MSFHITSTVIQTEKIREQVVDDTCGAYVVFEGIVRNHHNGKSVTSLRYEHHPALAQSTGDELVQKALDKFPITAAYAVHRIGECVVGECAVFIAIASSHRAEAFQACQFLIDEIKTEVPIWKFETYADGESVYTAPCPNCIKS